MKGVSVTDTERTHSPLLTAEDVAELIGMTPAYVYRLVRGDEIPHLRFGRTVRFRRESVERWCEERERGG